MRNASLLAAAAAIAASAVALPALAGSLAAPTPEPTVAPPVPMAAPAPVRVNWTGGYVGADLGYNNVSSNNGAASGNGGIGGLMAGYNYDFGKFVVGGEVGFDKANTGLGAGGKLKSTADIKLRAGVGMGKALVYGTVGAMHANGNIAGVGIHGTGGLIGAGVDYALNDHWVVGGEADYGRINNADKAGTDLDNTTLMARVAFKF